LSNQKTISSLYIVPAGPPAPVKYLLSQKEKQFLDLLAEIIVKKITQPTKL